MLAWVVFGQWLRDRAEAPDATEAVRIGERALPYFLERGDVLGTFFTSLLIGVAQNRLGHYVEARQALIPGLEALERTAEGLSTGIVRLILADSLRLFGDLAGARRLCDEVLLSRRGTAYPIILYHALSRSGECYLTSGEYDRARRDFTESLVLTEKLGQSNMGMWPLRGLADVLYGEGDYGGAKRLLVEILESARSVGTYPDRDDVRVSLGRVECALGNYAEAAALLTEALAVSERLQTVNKRTKALAAIAVLLHETGRPEPAAHDRGVSGGRSGSGLRGEGQRPGGAVGPRAGRWTRRPSRGPRHDPGRLRRAWPAASWPRFSS